SASWKMVCSALMKCASRHHQTKTGAPCSSRKRPSSECLIFLVDTRRLIGGRRRAFLRRRACFHPARDSIREMFHVGVTEFLGSHRGGPIGVTLGTAAISDDKRAFVFWQKLRQLLLV